jgi:hypothetical protein
MLIHAAVAEPYNRIVWRELQAWAAINHTRISEVVVGVPAAHEEQRPELPDTSAIWQPYWEVKAQWQEGSEFKNRFAEEKEYRHSLPEESEALGAAAKNLEKLNSDKNFAELIRSDQSLSLLLKLYQAASIEPYVLFSLGDTGIARDYEGFRAKNRGQLEEYMDKFVVPLQR